MIELRERIGVAGGRQTRPVRIGRVDRTPGIGAGILRGRLAAQCGGKKIAAQLIRDVGFDPVDAGPLRIARYTEPFTLLIAQLAYEGDAGPELAYRFEWFGK